MLLVSWINQGHGMTMGQFLNGIRYKLWESLETTDAQRFTRGRVKVDNIPKNIYTSLESKLTQMAAMDGELGNLRWREDHMSTLKDGTRFRTTTTVTTMRAIRFLFGLNKLEFDLSGDSSSFGWGFLRISDLRQGDISFVDLPLFLECVTDVRLGAKTISLEIGYGIGVVGNGANTYVRHATGGAYESFEDGDPGSLKDWKTAPIVPPYNSYSNYMQLLVGQEILAASEALNQMDEEDNPHRHNIQPNILTQAQGWSRSPPQENQQRRFWHHPKLTEAYTGDATLDHVLVKIQRKRNWKLRG